MGGITSWRHVRAIGAVVTVEGSWKGKKRSNQTYLDQRRPHPRELGFWTPAILPDGKPQPVINVLSSSLAVSFILYIFCGLKLCVHVVFVVDRELWSWRQTCRFIQICEGKHLKHNLQFTWMQDWNSLSIIIWRIQKFMLRILDP